MLDVSKKLINLDFLLSFDSAKVFFMFDLQELHLVIFLFMKLGNILSF